MKTLSHTAPPSGKYRPQMTIDLPNRQWPSQTITQAPKWCEVGLRDGNQALENPMTPEQKMLYFQELVRMGFKEIEIGFPSASQTDYDFCRELIEGNHIPDDVTIQVLVQCREGLIKRTCEAISGAKNVIVHFYNSTDPVQRRLVFQKDKNAIKELAIKGAGLVKKYTADIPEETNIRFEYSPESFSDTELDYAISVCEAVMKVIEPTENNKMIINVPQTVQRTTPNVFADQVEYFGNQLPDREKVEISLHAHNDCGTGVAATEMGIMAGADRVEGVLFGNGERCGNVDIVNVAGNLYSRGIDPQINLSQIEKTAQIYSDTTGMAIHPRHPYAGDLVFTAFSGSHQDSIKKGMNAMQTNTKSNQWDIHYLHVDPKDLGRDYEPVKVNTQSGKGGSAFILEKNYGIDVPKEMHPIVYDVVQKRAEQTGQIVSPSDIYNIFDSTFMRNERFRIEKFKCVINGKKSEFSGSIYFNNELIELIGTGNGSIDAFCNALKARGLKNFILEKFDEKMRTLDTGSDSTSYAFVGLRFNGKDVLTWGVGCNESSTKSPIMAILAAMESHHSQ